MKLTKSNKIGGVSDIAAIHTSAESMIRIYGARAQNEAEQMRLRMITHGRVDGEITWSLIAEEIKRRQENTGSSEI